jgi:D-glycerate 3-kinase
VVSAAQLQQFVAEHRLPDAFHRTATNFYDRLAAWLRQQVDRKSPFLLGINGAQGTGKSTLADYLALAIGRGGECNIAVLSIDDFYLTSAERQRLAATVHPLLAVRGVPGTHDIALLRDCLSTLRGLGSREQARLPRFDKARDDRADEASWPAIAGPVGLIILEGWCVGSAAESEAGLDAPVNALERARDPDKRWRRYVNDRLAADYADVFAELDALVFLQAPDFEAIRRWRIEQEHKLAASADAQAAGIMNDEQVREFIQHFERITRNNLQTVRSCADIVLELNAYHDCVASHYRE